MAKVKSLSDKIETIINNQKLSFKIKLVQLQTLRKKNPGDQFLGSVIDEISREAKKEASVREALGAEIAEKLRVQEANAADSYAAPAVKEKMSAETFINKFVDENPNRNNSVISTPGMIRGIKFLLNDYLEKNDWVVKMIADNPDFYYFCRVGLTPDVNSALANSKLDIYLDHQVTRYC